jgi:small subunit ribosomal protein S11
MADEIPQPTAEPTIETAPAAVVETTAPAAAPVAETAAPAAAPAAAAEAKAPKVKGAKAAKAAAEAAAAAPPVHEAPKDAAQLMNPDEEKVKIVKLKGSKNITVGVVNVLASFNNTIVSVTDVRGNVIGWSSAGKMGFKGSRKSTAYAAQLVSQDACRQAMGHGMREAEVRVKGPGSGRESAVRAVQAIGIDVTIIKDVTPIPHNGCRPPKARRV